MAQVAQLPSFGSGSLRQSSFDKPRTVSQEEEEVVTVRAIPGVDEDADREVRISCPDATGLGCDIARLLLDFGLRIMDGDVSTDGRWCFMIFKVKLGAGVPAHWPLLKRRLEAICPNSHGDYSLWRDTRRQDFQHPFLLQVTSYDRRGFLHDLMHTLWEADVVVFKAHITTGPGGKVLDMFWIYDNRCELPENHRVLQITELVRECLQQRDANCTILPAPPETCDLDSTATILQRCACKDATAVSPLRKILSNKRKGSSSAGSLEVSSESDEFGSPENVQVMIDNCTASNYSVVNVVCRDRKGLVYDLMRTLKDIHVRVAYAKIVVRGDLAETDLFVEEADGQRAKESRMKRAASTPHASALPHTHVQQSGSHHGDSLYATYVQDQRIKNSEIEAELIERVRAAVLLPVRIDIKDVYDETCTELRVTAALDSGGRGRPRVTYDVTAALNAMGLCVFMADVYMEAPSGDGDQRPHELHRFLVHGPDGRRLESVAEKRAVYECVRAQVTGTQNAQSARTTPRSSPKQSSPAPPPKSLLDSLSKWKWSV
ncbi:g8901 [Coccomyxa elongata]